MNETGTPPAADPRAPTTKRTEVDRAERQAREAAALRENLRRRKLQARGRAEGLKADPVEQS